MKIKKHLLLLLIALFSVSNSVMAQKIWDKIPSQKQFHQEELEVREIKPTDYKLYTIDLESLNINLSKSTSRSVEATSNVIVKLPTPLGVQRFKISEASVFSDELAAKYPTIKSYVGIGLDDPTAVVRFSKSNAGFHAMISSGNYSTYLIDPYTKDKKIAVGYLKRNSSRANFECLVTESKKAIASENFQKTANANDGKLRTYRLALIGTAEYSQFHITQQGVAPSATDAVKKAAVLAAMNTSMTRVNGVFERDLSVTLKIVSNNTDLIFLDGASDGLTDDDAGALINESQTKCDNVIGSTNYDIGHAFGTGGTNGSNGLAGGGVVCLSGQKAQGVTMSPSPINDTFDIDFIAHEMGHQFGANHTQNNSCQRNSSTAVEPGSASTIMGYAGICSPNVQNNSDAYFHSVNIAEMWNIVTTSATCGVETVTNNTAPVANAGNDFTIPRLTSFVLKGAGTDADAGNNLTYNWEQTDNQTATMPPSASNAVGPMFRSLNSSASPNRYMPALATLLAGNSSSTWEVVPSVSRTLNFSLTVRDNVANGASTARDNMIITVDGNSGPFIVTSQPDSGSNTTLNGGSTQTVTWAVNNTNVAPVNCSNVNILLSVDGGLTYGTTLLANAPNNGTAQVVLPNNTVAQARIMVEAVDNVFFDINAANFSIDKVTSVDEELFTNFSLYPNPSKGKVTVKFDVLNATDPIGIQLFDIRGRLIDEQQFLNTGANFSKELNYGKVSSGLYFIKIKNGLKQISKKILIE